MKQNHEIVMNSTAKNLILYAMWDTAHGCGDGAVKANLTCVKLGRLSGGPAKKIQGYNMIQTKSATTP